MELCFAHGPLRAIGEIPFRSGIRRVANHGLNQHPATLVQVRSTILPVSSTARCTLCPASSTVSSSKLPT